VNRLARAEGGWRIPEFALDLEAPTLLVDLPLDLDRPDETTAAFVREIQPRLREAFAHYLPRYTITDCARLADRVTYVLQREVEADIADPLV
jgi:predicted GNAT superfamily acetyltransferase